MLQERGVAGGTVSHTSARIGDARDAWQHVVIAHVNERAGALGMAPGRRLKDVLLKFVRG